MGNITIINKSTLKERKMENSFILSIIIPTRNRQNYAYVAALQILESTSSKVQVVIQDNSDEPSLITKFKDEKLISRIKYNYSPQILSFVSNFSKGVEIADGEYICIIGDDDGINPEIELFVTWARDNNIEAITPEIKLNYIWPGTGISYYKKDTGNLTIVDFNLKYKFYDPKKELNKLLNSGGQNYLNYNLVKVYHGIIKKSLMEEIKGITGKYFGGLSPDIFSSVALSFVTDRVLKIDYPLTIPGVCNKSGAGHSSTGRHHGNLKDAPQLKGHRDYQWSSLVPRFYSVETLWADSSVAAFRKMGKFELLKKFNVIRLSTYCYLNYKQFNILTNENLKNYRLSKDQSKLIIWFKLFWNFILGPFKDYVKRAINKIFRRKNNVIRLEGVKDINAAAFELKKFIDKKNISINDLINSIRL
jgi:glycosyltransferase involved in cell wall biosynthesis